MLCTCDVLRVDERADARTEHEGLFAIDLSGSPQPAVADPADEAGHVRLFGDRANAKQSDESVYAVELERRHDREH